MLKYASSSHPWKAPGWGDRVKGALRKGGERVHCVPMTLLGWYDAAYGGQSTEGKCRLGYVIGLMSSTLKCPCHISQWTSKFTRKMVKSSLGGEVYALSEMVDHMLLLKDFYGPSGGINPGVVGMGDCESLFTHLKTKKMAAEKYLVRHFLSIQQALEEGDLENAYWPPGTENPADGLTKVRSDMVTPLRLLESGGFCPGQLRPLKGVAWKE